MLVCCINLTNKLDFNFFSTSVFRFDLFQPYQCLTENYLKTTIKNDATSVAVALPDLIE